MSRRWGWFTGWVGVVLALVTLCASYAPAQARTHAHHPSKALGTFARGTDTLRVRAHDIWLVRSFPDTGGKAFVHLLCIQDEWNGTVALHVSARMTCKYIYDIPLAKDDPQYESQEWTVARNSGMWRYDPKTDAWTVFELMCRTCDEFRFTVTRVPEP